VLDARLVVSQQWSSDPVVADGGKRRWLARGPHGQAPEGTTASLPLKTGTSKSALAARDILQGKEWDLDPAEGSGRSTLGVCIVDAGYIIR
jgi:hypothetical protein